MWLLECDALVIQRKIGAMASLSNMRKQYTITVDAYVGCDIIRIDVSRIGKTSRSQIWRAFLCSSKVNLCYRIP